MRQASIIPITTRIGRRTLLLPLHKSVRFCNLDDINKFELGKFMHYNSKLPKVAEGSSIKVNKFHEYSSRLAKNTMHFQFRVTKTFTPKQLPHRAGVSKLFPWRATFPMY